MVQKKQFIFPREDVWPERSVCDVELDGVKVASAFPANSTDIYLRTEDGVKVAKVPHDPRTPIGCTYKDGVIVLPVASTPKAAPKAKYKKAGYQKIKYQPPEAEGVKLSQEVDVEVIRGSENREG